MRRVPTVIALVAAVIASAAIGTAQGRDADAAIRESPRRLVATVITRNDRGKVFCALWRGREGYPTQRRFAVGQVRDRTIVDRRGHCVFEGVTAGEYAIAAFHDENANNDLDRNIFGIPSEGTGASNDARGFMSPPSYDDARFTMPDVPLHRITIRIGY